MEQKTPVSPKDYLQAKRCIAVSPHIIGALTLLAAIGLMTTIVTIAKSTIVLCWIVGVVYAVLGVVGAEDVVIAWEKGEGRWYRRARDGETVWEDDGEGW